MLHFRVLTQLSVDISFFQKDNFRKKQTVMVFVGFALFCEPFLLERERARPSISLGRFKILKTPITRTNILGTQLTYSHGVEKQRLGTAFSCYSDES